MKNLWNRLWNGPYPLVAYLLVTSIGAAIITGVMVVEVGQLTYHGQATIAGATHISETFFTGLLVAVITAIVLHRHATRRGSCWTLAQRQKCPFLGILLLGLALGGISTLAVWFLQGTGDISYATLMRTKLIQGVLLGLFIPPLLVTLGLLKHPDIQPVSNGLPPTTPPTGDMGTVFAYIRNLIIGSLVANIVLFPGLSWLFYHGHPVIEGAVVGTELFFGGVVCTLISGVTGHYETAGKSGCLSCRVRGNCPFLGIFILGILLGIVCAAAGHFYLGNADVPFKTLIYVKFAQAIFLGLVIPVALIQTKLLLHPQVAHRL